MRTVRLARITLVCVASALAVELTLRFAALGYSPFAAALREWDPAASNIELRGQSCFRARPQAVFRFPNGKTAHANRMGFRGPEVAVPKPPGTFRVVLLGGSTSHGFLVDDDETIDAHLRRSLAVPGASRIEVVNLGFDTLDVLCDRERLRDEGLPLEPDAVILHSGINDVAALRFAALDANAEQRGQRAQVRNAEEARRRERGAWATVKHLLYVARLPGVLRKLLAGSVPAPGPAEPVPAALDAFEETVRGTIDLVPPEVLVLLSSPPSNLRSPAATSSWSPGSLIVDAATTQRYRDRLDARMRHIADDLAARGRRVVYVPHQVPDADFLDDCHLTSDGNRLLADDFARALEDLRAR